MAFGRLELPTQGENVGKLVRFLEHEDGAVRYEAATALSSPGLLFLPEAAPLLAHAVEHGVDEAAKRAAAGCFGKLGNSIQSEYATQVLKLLEHTEQSTRMAASVAFAQLPAQVQGAHYLLLTTCYLLLATCYLLLTTYY